MGDQHELLEGLFLSPRNDVEVGDFQSALLNKAFESESVKNIAITGPVGCGKSSFIKSFEAANGKRFAYLSLADFDYRNVDKGKDTEESECVKSLNALERKIIDQLSVVSNSNSSIKWVKTEYPSAKVSFNARALAMAFVAFLVVTVIALALCVQVVSHPFAGESSAYPIGITAALLVLLIVVLSVWYVKSGCPPIVKSLSLEGVRAEVESDVKSCSYFDEHLSFIIELFDAREEDAFVFEDLDRLSQSEILGQLRELNLTLNLARGSSIKPIRFVYCLADDVLLGESRTKFFDLMIPIVPIVDGYNSYCRIVEQLSGAPGNISKDLLRNSSLYIDDFRLLKTIVTDYRVYVDTLNVDNQRGFDCDKLFAMMAIKNVAPSLYVDLERRQGKLYKFLENLSTDDIDLDLLRPSDFNKDLREYCQVSLSENGLHEDRNESIWGFLTYLIRSGFIDEGYYFYLARPDSKRISNTDRNWLMMARNGEESFDWPLNDPAIIFSYLHDYEFLRPSTMNLSLVEYMSSHCSLEDEAFKKMIECAFEEAPEYGSLAVSCIPNFSYAVIKRYPDFLISDHEYDESLFVLSVVSGLLHDGALYKEHIGLEQDFTPLIELDAKNNGAIVRVLSDFAGLYSAEQIALFEKAFHFVIENIVAALGAFEKKASVLGEDASKELILALLSSGSYLQTEHNIRIALECETGTDIRDENVLDAVISATDSITLRNLIENPKNFVAEYLTVDDVIVSSNDSFVSLVNLEMDGDSREKLAEAYKGEVEALSAIADSSIWGILLQNAKVSHTVDNAFDYLKECGLTAEWVEYINSFRKLSFRGDECDSELLSIIEADVLNADSLDDDKYEAFLSLFSDYSIAVVPKGVSGVKFKQLFELKKVSMSADALSAMRDEYAGGYCLTYIVGDIEGYMRCVADSSPSDGELSDLLVLDEVKRGGYQSKLVSLLNGPIMLRPDYDDETLKLLIDAERLSDASFESSMKRYGRNELLDDSLVQLAERVDPKWLADADIDRRLIVDVVSDSPFSDRITLLRYVATWPWPELTSVLKAFGNKEIDRIIANSHPKYPKLSDETKEVIRSLVEAGRVSVKNERVYIRPKAK